MYSILDHLLGLNASPSDLTWGQIIARTFTVFVFGVLLVRFADRRFLGRNAGFDASLIDWTVRYPAMTHMASESSNGIRP